MLPKAIIAIYSAVLLAAAGGALGYVICSRWRERTRLFWALVAAAAVLFVLVFHPSDQTLDELRMWLPDSALK
jgi:drug/metabolite transporter (DMT)-like permease